MAIKSIKLENFTVFENIECEFSSGINIFIGENGTGKTHMLKALYAFCNASASDSSLPLELRSLFNSSPIIKGVLNRKMDKDVKLKAELGGKTYDYTLSISDDKSGYSGKGDVLTGEIFSIFIPAKEMLSISNITRIGVKFSKTLAFDKTLFDIITKAQALNLDTPPKLAKKIAPKLEAVIGGTVFVKESDLTFWIRKTTGEEILFAMEAEGIRKFGLLWQLLMNGSLERGTVLFWDEPEANLNPKLIPALVDVLIELAKNGVQVFLATHEFNLMQYFNLKNKDDDNMSFISFYKNDKGVVAVETAEDYTFLEHNPIVEADIKMLKDDMEGVL